MTGLHTARQAAVQPETTTPRRVPARSRLRELLAVAALLLALELLMFWGYFSGMFAPPWDFMGSYNTEAYAWWTEGSFFQPADWISHSWGGYPAAASIQNSAWYLPVGLVAAIVPFTIHASAALAALHYAFGAAGVYLVGRLSGLGRTPSTFGLVSYFFVAGFFAQAEHVDIARGFAWLPWLAACTAPFWPWRRWWGIPVAALVFWQALLGTYPGMIVAAAYCLAVWVVVYQVSTRTPVRAYLVPLGAAGIVALLLLTPKYVPVFLLDSASTGAYADTSQISWSLLATAFLPYGNPAIPTDIALRSFFLPVTCFVLALLVNLRNAFERAALAVLVVAVALGTPSTPWHDLVSQLPGLAFSRFRLSDFRSLLLLTICFLAMASLAQLLARAPQEAGGRTRGDVRAAVTLTLLPLGVLALAVANGFDSSEWTTPVLLVTTACAVVALVVLPLPHRFAAHRIGAQAGAGVLILLTVVSGATWAYATPAPWRSPRVFAETASFGATVDALISARNVDEELTQRPGRTPVTEPAIQPEIVSTLWNDGYYDNSDNVGGLVNLKRNPSFQALLAALLDPAQVADVNYFYSAPGSVVALVDGNLPPREGLESCVVRSSCGPGLAVSPVRYEPGHLEYAIRADAATPVALNESYYLGWNVRACPVGSGPCQDLQAGRGPAGAMIVDIPAGAWTVQFDYIPPGSVKAWFTFAGGGILIASWITFAAWRHFRARRRDRRAAAPIAPPVAVTNPSP